MKFTQEEYETTLHTVAHFARQDFVCFLHTMFPQAEDQNYILGDLHLFLGKMFQDTVEGRRSSYQTVSVPPQHGKSRLISVRGVAWALGAFPNISIALTGFSYSLLCEFVDEAVQLINTPMYQRIFPDVNVRFGQNRRDSKKFTNGSSLMVKSSGSKLTGRRVDLLIIDDPHAGREEAESAGQREKIRRWYFADCVTRLSPQARVFLVMTRWHPEDLVGSVTHPEFIAELQASDQPEKIFDVVNLEAIAENPNDPLGRKHGEALFPQGRPLKFLEGLKASLPRYEWDSQYMGNPKARASGQVLLDRLKKIELSSIENLEDIEWVRGWDLALTQSTAADWTVGALCGLDKKRDLFYIGDIFRTRETWMGVRSNIGKLAINDRDNWGAHRMGMEAVSGFEVALQEVRRDLEGLVRVEKRNPKSDKLVRARPWLNKVDAGKAYMVIGPWNRAFIDELDVFPAGRHDDQIDAVSVAYECLANSGKLLYA